MLIEVAQLPGCGRKIAELYQEWKDTKKTKEAGEINADPRLATLALFYDIWGVGDVTARNFYNKGGSPLYVKHIFTAQLIPPKVGEISTTW